MVYTHKHTQMYAHNTTTKNYVMKNQILRKLKELKHFKTQKVKFSKYIYLL